MQYSLAGRRAGSNVLVVEENEDKVEKARGSNLE